MVTVAGYPALVKNGMEHATFKESDFKFEGCTWEIARSHSQEGVITGKFDPEALVTVHKIAMGDAMEAYKMAYMRELLTKKASKFLF